METKAEYIERMKTRWPACTDCGCPQIVHAEIVSHVWSKKADEKVKVVTHPCGAKKGHCADFKGEAESWASWPAGRP